MRVGITTKQNFELLGMSLAYANFFENKYKAEIIPLPINLEVETWQKYYAEFLDLVVLVGGKDVDPRRYQDKKQLMSGEPDYYLEDFDLRILPEVIKTKTPIFGICRGFQSLNVYFGGKLNQHLWYHPTSNKDRSEKIHSVWYTNTDGNKDSIQVNSLHHQGIEKNDLAPDLKLLAWYSKDIKKGTSIDLVEAFYHKTLPIGGVQWHPEELMGDILSEWILKKILS